MKDGKLALFIKQYSDALFHRFPRYAGGAVALFGLLIIVSWYRHWQFLLQMLPDSAPMQYNTALCFILTGAGLFLLTTRRAVFTLWLGGATAIFTLLTLLEYATDSYFGIDLMFYQPFFEAATTYPGRMSPLAAVCFILTGTGLVVAVFKREWRYRLTAAAMLACMAGIIALVALCGFIFDIKAAYSWGSFSTMAVNTAVIFYILSSGLLCWCLQAARRENVNFFRWLPGTAAVTLMAMIAFVSATNTLELRNATFWREHTLQVIFKGQEYLDNLLEIQRSVMSYVTLNDEKALAAYQNNLSLESQQLSELGVLTQDNSAQQRRLKEVAVAVDDLRAYDRRLTALYEKEGFEGVTKANSYNERQVVFGKARDAVKIFLTGERKLLATRDVNEQKESRNGAHLLVFGSVLAAALLVFANYAVDREMKRRRRIELEREKLIKELQDLLAEVKTLSGMIPICAWCKNVRSDKGYWETVEQYVHSHTEATFSHGICPVCYEKFKAENGINSIPGESQAPA